MDQKDVIDFLSDPRSYGLGVAHVERHETHGAIVFLAGDKAYKLKRAIRLPYMDYSTVEKRRAMCEAELSVNRRTAPELYLAIKPIVRDGSLRFGAEKERSEVVDWVVVMKRFDQSALLEEMRKRNALDEGIVRALADSIAMFHKAAEIRRDAAGAAGISAVVEENIDMLRRYRDKPFAPEKIETYVAASRRTLSELSLMLDQRRELGFVRRCHGDLHLNNICLIDGKPLLFDAIEFSEEFGSIDVFYDLAFLLMDMEHHWLHRLANELLNRYLLRTDDFWGLAALPLFMSCRAAIRAHIAATRADQSNTDEKATRAEAGAYLDEAIALLEPKSPRLIALGAYSGAGKSTVARLLAPRIGQSPGAVIVRSDLLRKKLFGASETSHLPDEAYSPAAAERVYALLMEQARKILASGYSVIADAVFGLDRERDEIAAASGNAEFLGVWLEAPASVLEQRIVSRRGDASDATVEVLHRQLKTLKPPPDWQHIDASGSPDAVADLVLASIGRDNTAISPALLI